MRRFDSVPRLHPEVLINTGSRGDQGGNGHQNGHQKSGPETTFRLPAPTRWLLANAEGIGCSMLVIATPIP